MEDRSTSWCWVDRRRRRRVRIVQSGDIVNCQNPVVSGVTVDGGIAEVMIAESRGIVPFLMSSVPQTPPLSSALVSRLTTLFATRLARRRSVAVQGLGGLGHLGIQFARHMGFHTVAIGADARRRSLRKIWARTSISRRRLTIAAAVLQQMGGARAILAKLPSGDFAWGHLCPVLPARGKLIVVGVPSDQIQLSAFPDSSLEGARSTAR